MLGQSGVSVGNVHFNKFLTLFNVVESFSIIKLQSWDCLRIRLYKSERNFRFPKYQLSKT